MRVLVACEFSGVVREAFRKKGHDAWSCDLLPSADDSPHHLRVDAQHGILDCDWDLMIAHPPCTYLCLSGARWLYKNGKDDWLRWENMRQAADFFRTLLYAPIEKICVENPLPHRHGLLPKFTQSIQPYNFGEDASKRTCLWLKNLPPLKPTEFVEPRMVEGMKRWANQTDSGQNKLPPSKDRGMLRSITYQGIADAMAEQWG